MPHVFGDDDGIGFGVSGASNTGDGVRGYSNRGSGVLGFSFQDGNGVYGRSERRPGVYGWSTFDVGVAGRGGSWGVSGWSNEGIGVDGGSYNGIGVLGRSTVGVGVSGLGTTIGVDGLSRGGTGVRGHSESGYGIYGYCKSGIGIAGHSDRFVGIDGWSNSAIGIRGYSYSETGVYGHSYTGYAFYGYSNSDHAAYLDGDVIITGNLQKAGGQFKIDHPLDPANKYLCHSFVESPDMKNVYDGVVILDDKGEAEIELPDWFGALNKDFRYQLTAIGAPGPNLYIAEEIISDTTTATRGSHDEDGSDDNNNNRNRFKIAGGKSGMKVSWQVTGIRKDPWANAYRIQVEEDKPDKERGYYMYPDLYGQPEEKGISHLLFPKDKEQEPLRSVNDGKPIL